MKRSWKTWCTTAAALALTAGGWLSCLAADGKKAFTDAAEAGADYQVQGEYQGDKFGVQVIARGDGKFDAVYYPGGLPGAGWDAQAKPKTLYKGATADGKTTLSASEGKLQIADGKLQVVDAEGKTVGEAKRVERKSPTLGAKAPAGAVVLFDGSTAENFNGGKLTPDGCLDVGVKSKQAFGDFTLHMEFNLPYMPYSSGQGRGNSGCYLQDRYECQILDSFGLEGKDNECGGFYQLFSPSVNMCLPPLQWQTYDIDFTAAKFDADGKKTANARATVKHNGVVIHDNVELARNTAGGQGENAKPGPIQLQNHGNPVRFRNIWVVEKN